MKKIRFLMFVLTIGTLLLSACGAAAASAAPVAVGGGKVEAMPVAFVGTVNSIAGNQWVISGTTITVDPSVVRDGPFSVGDQVKVEGAVNADGSFTVSRVELPAPQDVSGSPQFGDDHGVDANINDDHGNDANVNDDHGNDASINNTNVNDDHGGVVSPSNNNTTDDHSAGGGNSNKDSGGKGSGGGGKGSGGGGSDDGGNHG